MDGIITEIQHASIHDGPGIRSVVFLKGCQMHCFWCHNPEAIRKEIQIWFQEKKCLHCGACFSVCSLHQLSEGEHRIDRERCTGCGRCADRCFSGALTLCGKKISVEMAVEDLMQDELFYQASGGGITLSGGEPGMQPEFAEGILRQCRARGIHTALETNLAYPESIRKVLCAEADLVMADLKQMDPGKHREGTGCGNRQILENLRRMDRPLILRTPLIPGFNDDTESIRRIAEFAASLKPLLYYELLTYHPLGCGKAVHLGMKSRCVPLPEIPEEKISELTESAAAVGIPLYRNGKEWRI